MRIALRSDSPVIGRTLSDLLALLQCEIATADSAGTPQLHYTKGQLHLTDASGTTQALTQPISLRQLASELQRTQHTARGAPLKLAHGWRLEPLARMLHHDAGQHIPLTEKESLLLAALVAALPQAAAREQLLRDVWAYAGDSETHTLETHIYRLRSKLTALTPPPADIITCDGTYRLDIAGAA